jgi:hypothetical protein
MNTYVDASTLLEEGAHGPAAALGSNEDDIDVLGRDDLCVILEDDGEPVREVERLALDQVGLDVLPRSGLGSVRKKVHDDGTALKSLVDGEERLSRNLDERDNNIPVGDKQRGQRRTQERLTQPSFLASSQLSPSSRTPTITLRPLSRAFRPCPWPRAHLSHVSLNFRWTENNYPGNRNRSRRGCRF